MKSVKYFVWNIFFVGTVALSAQEPVDDFQDEAIEVDDPVAEIYQPDVLLDGTEIVSEPQQEQSYQEPEVVPDIIEQGVAADLAVPMELDSAAPEGEKPVLQDASVALEGAQATGYLAETPVAATGSEDPLQEELAEIEGVDTVDLDSPQGNWLFKRIWWERAERKYEKIRGGVQAIFESRMRFFSGRSELDRAVLDPFYLAIGFGQGELSTILNELVGVMQDERERQGALDSRERAFLDTLQGNKDALEAISKDVEGINQLDVDIDDALAQLMEQINRVRSYDRDAWNAFKEIARVLDDVKARELFYQVETSWRNIKDVHNYIDTVFAAHFDELLTKVNEHVERVKGALSALKEKGIDLKEQVRLLTQDPAPQESAFDEDDDDEYEQEPAGIVATIGAAASWLFDSIIGIIRLPYDLIFGDSEDADYDEDDDDE